MLVSTNIKDIDNNKMKMPSSITLNAKRKMLAIDTKKERIAAHLGTMIKKVEN